MSYPRGQKLVCVNPYPWFSWEQGKTFGPKLNDVVTSDGPCSCGCGYIHLKEYPRTDAFDPKFLRPVQEADLTASIASEWKESVPTEQEHVNEPQHA